MESHKTFNNKIFLKSGDIGQVLVMRLRSFKSLIRNDYMVIDDASVS